MSSKQISRALLAVLVASACTLWERLDDLSPADSLLPRQQVQVWSGGQASLWHAVRIGDDSIRGVPYHLPPTCDSCRVAIARASVDSLRLGDQEGSGMLWIGSLVVLFLFFVTSLSHLGDGT